MGERFTGLWSLDSEQSIYMAYIQTYISNIKDRQCSVFTDERVRLPKHKLSLEGPGVFRMVSSMTVQILTSHLEAVWSAIHDSQAAPENLSALNVFFKMSELVRRSSERR